MLSYCLITFMNQYTVRVLFTGVPIGAILQHPTRHAIDNHVECCVISGRGTNIGAAP